MNTKTRIALEIDLNKLRADILEKVSIDGITLSNIIDEGIKTTLLACKEALNKSAMDNQMTVMWISVKDRLPEKNCEYLVFLDNCFICAAFLNKENIWYEMWGSKPLNVTYWMPLPEAPKD